MRLAGSFFIPFLILKEKITYLKILRLMVEWKLFKKIRPLN